MYKISTLDHLAAKVDALFQKFDKMSISAVTPAPVSPPCEVCGVFGHTDVECQLGRADEGVEQMNYAQYNQGMRQNQLFFIKLLKIPMDKQHNLVMQTTKESLKNPAWNF